MSNKLEILNSDKRHKFNPSNKNDLKKAKEFLYSSRWGPTGCPFHLEWPYEDVPYMLKTKITEYYLKGLK